MEKKLFILLGLLLSFALRTVQAQNLQDYVWETNADNTITITSYTGSDDVLIIPSTINGLAVSSIGDMAFYYWEYLANVTIPNSVTSIGANAFSSPYNYLTNVTLGNSVTNIGDRAFYGCKLTSVTIPNSLTSIGNSVFLGCPLTSVVIPDSVTNIANGAFAFCALTNVTIGKRVTSIEDYVFQDCTELISVCFEGDFPTNFNGTAFYGDTTKVIYYLSGATGWGFSSFAGIPTTPCAQCAGAAVNTGSLQVTLSPAEAVSAGAEWQLDGAIDENSGAIVTNLSPGSYTVSFTPISGWTTPFNQDVSITGGATTSVTGVYAEVLQSQLIYTTNADNTLSITGYIGPGGDITIPTVINGLPVTGIGDFAFYYYSTLSTVMIPDSVTNIGDAPFEGCASLRAITVDSQNSFFCSVNGVLFDKSRSTVLEYPDGLYGGYTIPATVNSIGEYAFIACTNLTSVTISESVASIGKYAFAFCSSLTNVTIPNGVTSIGDDAFDHCLLLTNVTIPKSVTNIGFAPFESCFNLSAIAVNAENADYSSVNGGLFSRDQTTLVEYPGGESESYTIPNGVVNIEDGAFAGCEGLTNITIPNSVTTIGNSAFDHCLGLTRIPIPNSVTSFGDFAFADCGSLISVTIPGSVAIIGNYAFYLCSNLTGAYFLGNYPFAGTSVFFGDNVGVYYLQGTAGWDSNVFGVPTQELTPIAIGINSTNGLLPLKVSFTSMGIDGIGNTISNWNWDFGDVSTSTVQNPSHTYTTTGTFSIAVVETNRNGVPIAGSATSVSVTRPPVYLGLVLNGGFETGDFSGWTLSGNFSDTSVSKWSPYAYSGEYGAALGPSGSVSYLSQSLVTSAAAHYLLSLWLDNPDVQSLNEFLVSWNGNILFDETNIPASAWSNRQFLVSATGTNTVLEFGFREDLGFFGLDDISVVPAQAGIASVRESGTNLVLNGINGESGATYYVLTSTNLALPLNRWTPVATNVFSASGNFTITVTNTVTPSVPQSFYILKTQ